MVTAPLLGQMHIPTLLSQPLTFCASHYFLGQKKIHYWKSKIEGKPVNESNTEMVKKKKENKVAKCISFVKYKLYTEFRVKVRKMSFSEKEAKT